MSRELTLLNIPTSAIRQPAEADRDATGWAFGRVSGVSLPVARFPVLCSGVSSFTHKSYTFILRCSFYKMR